MNKFYRYDLENPPYDPADEDTEPIEVVDESAQLHWDPYEPPPVGGHFSHYHGDVGPLAGLTILFVLGFGLLAMVVHLILKALGLAA